MNLTFLVLGCLVWLPLTLWGVSLVHWVIQGEIDVISGVIGVGIAFALGYFCLKPPIPILSPISFGLVIVTIVTYPGIRSAMAHREMKSIDIDAVERAYQALSEKPGNPLAKFKLARHVYNVGMIGHAVAIADNVLPQMSDRFFPEEHRTVRKWKEKGVPPATLRPIECIDCHHSIQPGSTHCPACGAQFLLHRAKGKIMNGTEGRKLVAGWIALVAIVAGIPASSQLPPLIAASVILLLLGMAVTLVIVAFRTSTSRTA